MVRYLEISIDEITFDTYLTIHYTDQELMIKIREENLIKDQSIFPLVIILLTFKIFLLGDVLIMILSRENWCWSLLRQKG